MDIEALVEHRISTIFVTGENNCTMTMLKVLSEVFEIPLAPQVLAAATCLPGVGGTGGVCGLVSGALMFMGIVGTQAGWSRDDLRPIKNTYAEAFHQHFGSLDCRDLRDDPHHCAPLATEALTFTIGYIENSPLV